MKRFLLCTGMILWLLFADLTVNGQTLQGEWGIGNGGDWSVYPPVIQVDRDGNIYQAGTYTGATMNIGAIALNGGPNGSAYVAEISQDGQVAWVQNFETDGYLYADYFHADSDGTTRTVGSFTGNFIALGTDSLKRPAGVTNSIYYYLILNKDGSVQHFDYLIQPIDTSSYWVNMCDWDDQGNMAVVGTNDWNSDTLIIGNIGVSVRNGFQSIFLAYVDPSGTPVWATASDYTAGEFYQLMDLTASMTANSDIVIAGSYDGLGMVPVFGTDTLSFLTSGNVFMVEFDKTGNFLWATASEGQSYPFMAHLLATSDSKIYMSGTFTSDTLRFGAVELVNPSGFDDNFIVCFADDGTPQWGQLIQTENYGMLGKKKAKGQAPTGTSNSILPDSKGNIYLVTWFENDTIFLGGDTLINTNSYDNLVVKYAPDGTYLWAKNIPSMNGQVPSSTLDKKDQLYLFNRLDVSFTLDSVSFTSDGMSSPAFVIGFDENGTAVYGNTLTVPQYEDVTPYTIDADGLGHLILSGTFTSSVQINNVSVTAGYNMKIFLARLAYLTSMSGTVTDASANAVTAGTVYLYKLTGTGQAPVADSVALAADGTYEFTEFTYDQYLIYALPDTSVYTTAIGTYYGNETAWMLADTVQASMDTLSGLDIQITELTVPLNGSGTIEGIIEYDTTSLKSTASIMGEPVKKVKVILVGTEKSTQNVIAWVYTDDQGQYVFENIPDGNYSIIVDIPGLPMDSTYTVTVTGNVVSGLDFLVSQSEVKVNTSSNVDQNKTGVAEISLWPNPTNGRFTVAIPNGEISEITVFNSHGQHVRNFRFGNGVVQTDLDLSDQPAGIYYIRIIGKNKAGVKTLILQR